VELKYHDTCIVHTVVLFQSLVAVYCQIDENTLYRPM
jgi:hypothetical protein